MSKVADREPTLVSQSAAADLLGIPRRSLHIFIERNGIRPKPIAGNALAKGLDAADLAVLRKAWARVRVPASSK